MVRKVSTAKIHLKQDRQYTYKVTLKCTRATTVAVEKQYVLEPTRNVTAHAQKPELVFLRNGRVHFNRRGGQFSQLLAVEEC